MYERRIQRRKKVSFWAWLFPLLVTVGVLGFALAWKGGNRGAGHEGLATLESAEVQALVEAVVRGVRAAELEGSGTHAERKREALNLLAVEKEMDPDRLAKAVDDWCQEARYGSESAHYPRALAAYMLNDLQTAAESARVEFESAKTEGDRQRGYQSALLQADIHLAQGDRGALEDDLLRAGAFADRFSQPGLWADVQQFLASIYLEQQRYEPAEVLLRAVQSIRTNQGAPHNRMLPMVLNDLAKVLKNTERLPEAIMVLRRAVTLNGSFSGRDPATLARLERSLGACLWERGETVEAEVFLTRALKSDEAHYGPNHLEVAQSLHNLAKLYVATGRQSRSSSMMERAVKIMEDAVGKEHLRLAEALQDLGVCYQALNRMPDAESVLRRALGMNEKLRGKSHPAVADTLHLLASALVQMGQKKEAEEAWQLALKIDASAEPIHRRGLALHLAALAGFLEGERRFAEAEPVWRRCAQMDEALHGHFHEKVARDLLHLAECLDQIKRLPGCIDVLRDAMVITMRIQADAGMESPDTAAVTKLYVKQCRRQGIPDATIEQGVSDAWNLAGLKGWRFPSFWLGVGAAPAPVGTEGAVE